MKKFGLTALALLALWGGNLCAQVGYTYDSASNNNFSKAFDGNINTKFEGGNLAGNWMIIKTADSQPHVVKSYAISTHDDGSWPNRAPKTWTLEGSNDKSNWTLIDQVTNDPIENKNYTTFTFKDHFNFNAYTYLRFTMLTMKGTGWTQIAEFAVTDVPEADVETFRASKKTEYQTKVSELQAEVNNFKSTLGEDDPWTLEFISKCEGLSDLLNATTADYNYEAFGSAYNIANTMVSLKNQFTGSSYSAIDGSATWGDGHWTQLFDGKDGREGRASTKWGGNFSGNVGEAGHVQYVIFRSKTALQPYFYRLVTGGDTKTQSGRNWKSWKVYGANFSSISDATYANLGNWTVLDSRKDISAEYLPNENCYPAAFDFTEGVSESYYYYMIAVTESNGTQQQMNEMYLCTQAEFEDMRAPLVAYFDDFDTTRAIEDEYTDELADFNTKFAELKTTADAVKLTLLYNECVALRSVLEGSMDYLDLNKLDVVDGVYQLATADDLVLFGRTINAGRNDLKARLTADIDLKDVKMAPIGTEKNPFKGTFNGYGHAVKNFTYSVENENSVGLFGLTNGVAIAHLNLTGANIKGNANVGGLVGNAQNGTYIMDCAVVNSYVEGRDHVGAVVGEIRGNSTVQNCYSDADVYSRGYQAGGLAGTSRGGSLLNNLFLGSIYCAGGSVGGVVALIDAEDNNVKTTIKGNVIAATSINLGWGDDSFFYLTNINGKSPVIEDNYVLTTTKFRENKTLADATSGKQGTAVANVKDMTCQSFYETTLGWDLNADWCFYQAGKFPLPVIMCSQAANPSQTITVSEAGFGTAVAQFEIDFSNSDVKAYIAQVKVDAKNVNYVHLEPITIVPEGEAFVVKAAAGTYFVPAAVEWGVAESNDLKATTAELVANGTQYILAQVEGEVAFHQATENSVIPAGKGYLELDGAGPLVKAFFGDEESETAITNVNVNGNANNAAIYNMAGQRISKLQKGVNIVNGRKVLY